MDKHKHHVRIDSVEGPVHTGSGDINIFARGFFERRTQRKQRHNREIVLDRVKTIWIDEVLANSLHGMTLIELGKEKDYASIAHPWDVVVEPLDRPNYVVPSDKPILELFHEMGSALLILGTPGSGKTTTLLELARDAIYQAKADQDEPIPIVLNLSSWNNENLFIFDWIVDELKFKYKVPQKIGRDWCENNQLLLLLDGLDEVNPQKRDSCVKGINKFREE